MSRPLWRTILNVPDPAPAADSPEKETPTAEAEAPTKSSSTNGHPWTVEEERPAAQLARYAARALVFALVLILVLLGLRTLVRGPAESPVTNDPTEDYPTSEAQGVAARFATNYLTWTPDDEAAQQERGRGLALDVAGGSGVETEWSGNRRTSVRNVFPAGITYEEDGRTAFVTIVGQMQTWEKKEAAKAAPTSKSKSKKETSAAAPTVTEEATTPRWVALSVPVQVVGDRPVVAGSPAFVNLPRAGAATAAPDLAEDTDSKMTSATRDGAEAFFRAYAGEDGAALEQATAPGASMQPLASGMELSAVTAWRVDAGGDKTRTGHATVAWKAGESVVKQNYRVDLAAISSGTDKSWRVASVTAEIAE